jgi:hypothetical protein
MPAQASSVWPEEVKPHMPQSDPRVLLSCIERIVEEIEAGKHGLNLADTRERKAVVQALLNWRDDSQKEPIR